MIELITGGNGSGKTTYGVSQRLAAEVGREVALDDETCAKLGFEFGTKVKRRIVSCGVRGLILEHDRLPHVLTRDAPKAKEVARWNEMQADDDKEPVHQRLCDEPPREDVPMLVENWWLWARPGDLIVLDEAQYVMPKGSSTRVPPYWLYVMATHRHYGVDFLIITPHPQLIDMYVCKLVGMHRHIRSVMGSPVCMVYTWDHQSNPERYNMANKATFVRRAKHYKLFHSSVLHVKPPTSGRWALVAVPVLAGVGFLGLGNKIHGYGSPANAKAGSVAAVPAPSTVTAAVAVAQSRPQGFADVPMLQGCYAWGERCECLGVDGRRVRVQLAMCRTSASSFDGLVQWSPRKVLEVEARPKAALGAAGAASAGLPNLL